MNTNLNYERRTTDKKLYDGTTNSTVCKVVVNLEELKKIKNIINGKKDKVNNIFVNSVRQLSSSLNKDSNFDNFIAHISNANTDRITNIYNEIHNQIIQENLNCIVYLSDVNYAEGKISDINIHTKQLSVTYKTTNNTEQTITILLDKLCVDDNTRKQRGGYNAPSTQPIEEPLPNSPSSYGICE